MSSTVAITPDGVRLALHDLGGDGPPALLVHGTGFHGRSLGPLARNLGQRLHCLAPDLRGHGESGTPVDASFDWVGFATDVLTAVDALGLEHPVGIGHSAGAAALLLAEESRRGTFSVLYCFEPAMFAPEAPPPSDVSGALAKGARQRREVFASRNEAYVNYGSKPPLNVLDPEALAAYVEFGFEDLPNGTVRLRCRGEIEARTYESGVRNPAFPRLAEIVCPVVLACGNESEDFNPASLGLLAARLRRSRPEVLPDMGHFGPLQHPAAVAQSVIRALDTPPA